MTKYFENLRYNEITTIKSLVEKELADLHREMGKEIPLNIWYLQEKERLEALTTWQTTISHEAILGGILHRCIKYEEEVRSLFEKEKLR